MSQKVEGIEQRLRLRHQDPINRTMQVRYIIILYHVESVT